MTDPEVSRRDFLRRSAIGAGAAAGLYPLGAAGQEEPPRAAASLPREVWIATFSLMGLQAEDPEDMIRQVIAQMEGISSAQPDVICLPETFLISRSRRRPSPAEAASRAADYLRPFAEFAKRHRAWLIVPTYTTDGRLVYNSSLVLDRSGETVGEYRKMRPTEEEMEGGVAPGPFDPPVFQTDFGIIGAQICFDIEWAHGWERLREKGAEIVFWSSAFAGGSMINTAAWQNKVHVVSSTHKDTAKICDVSGEVLARTDRWSPNWAIAPVNLEKAFLHTWPYNRHFDAIRAKYGRSVRITSFGEEEWTILESLSPDVRVADVMREFGMRTHEETMNASERIHRRFWGQE